MGKPDAKRTKQAGSKRKAVGGKIEDLLGDRNGDGAAMGWVPVVFASGLGSCPDCDEPWCELHKMHYADCKCIGPDQAADCGYELKEIDGVLMALVPDA